MDERQKVAIKLPAYLKDFFTHEFGPEPISLTYASKIYPLLIQYISNVPKNWTLPEASQEVLHILMPNNKIVTSGRLGYFGENAMREIKSYVFSIFFARFISYMGEKVEVEKWNPKYAIINFMDRYDIIYNAKSYGALKKIFERYRNRSKGLRAINNIKHRREKKADFVL